MKRNSLICLILTFALIVPGIAWGQAKVGTAGVQFLKIGPSARGVGLADAFLPIADDVSTLWYNPGGLVNVKSQELLLSHTTLPADINYDFIGIVKPLPTLGAAVGVQVYGLYSGDMNVTTIEHPFGNGQTFSASDFAAGISYAQRLTDKFSVGTTVKYIQENLAEEVATGWSADVGTYYDTGWRSFKIAMVITNFGPDMTAVSSPYSLPMMFKFGVAINLIERDNRVLTLAFEGVHPSDNVEELHLGLEYNFNNFAYLRVGKKFNGFKRDSWEEFDDNRDASKNPYIEYPLLNEDGMLCFDGVALGGGLFFRGLGLSVDYAYTTYAYLGNLHRFSLGYRFR
jgi:hypothetical protein